MEIKEIIIEIEKETKLKPYIIENETNTIYYKEIHYLYFLDIIAIIIYKLKLVIKKIAYYETNLIISF